MEITSNEASSNLDKKQILTFPTQLLGFLTSTWDTALFETFFWVCGLPATVFCNMKLSGLGLHRFSNLARVEEELEISICSSAVESQEDVSTAQKSS